MLHIPVPETRVNTYTTGDQTNSSAVGLPDGGWLVIWTSADQDGDGSGLYQQMYNSDGTARGDETLVNTTTTGDQSAQSMAALNGGGWVVTWQSLDDQGGVHVYQQLFDSDGTTSGGETRVDAVADNIAYEPFVAALSDGGWVNVWTGINGSVVQQTYNAAGEVNVSETTIDPTDSRRNNVAVTALTEGGWVVTWSAQDGDETGVYQQVFDTDGSMLGTETRVNTTTAGYQQSQQVTALSDGGWVVTWQSPYSDEQDFMYGVYQQAYSANGTARGDETRVETQLYAYMPVIAGLADGGWVVAWQGSGDGSQNMFQQAYNADGTTRGNLTTLADLSPQPREAQIAALSDGGWVVIWQTTGANNNTWGIHQRAFDADGTARGDESQVNTYAGSFHDGTKITALSDGGWVVTWDVQDGKTTGKGDGVSEDGSGAGVYQQRYRADGTVYGSNYAPTAIDQSIVLLEDHSHTLAQGDFGFADATDGDSFSSVTITALPGNGTLTLNGVAVTADQVIAAADISHLVWTPDANANGDGLATIGFKVTDDGGTAGNGEDTSSAHTLTFNVSAVSDAPTGTDKTVTIKEGHGYTLSQSDFGFADAPDGDVLQSVTITALPGNGTLTLNGIAVTADQVIAAADISHLVWTPAADANGDALATIGFKLTDDGVTAGNGEDTSSTHTLTFDVTGVNDAPTGTDKTVTIKEDHSYTLSQSDFGFADAADGDVLQSVTITALPGNGTLTLNGIAVTADQVIAAADISHLVWTPAADANGDVLATIGFKLTDDGGTAVNGEDTSSTHTLTFDVTGVNDAPTGTDKTVTIKEDKNYTFKAADFGFIDANDKGDHLAGVKVTALPDSGKLTLDGEAVHKNEVISAADFSFMVWTPAKNANGKDLAHFNFKVMDDGGTADGGKDIAVIANTFTFNVTDVTDMFTGTKAANTLKGTTGHDVFNGKGGNDKLTGLGGSDTFVFGKNYDRDTITDFTVKGMAHDIVDLDKLSSIDSFKDLKADHMSQHGHDVWIDGGKGDVLVLRGVDIHDLGRADFLL